MSYFKNLLETKYKDKNIDLYVDMDGVITDYNLGGILDFKTKRPLQTNIKTLQEVSKLKNIKMNILSICLKDEQIKEKNDWLDKNAPFFEEKRRIIISKESNPNTSSKELKLNYLKNQISKTNNLIILIDDDNEILKHIKKEIPEIILFQDSSIID